jgi:hypothetical protein
MGAASLPLVKVIVPCYGYGHLLDDCVATIVDQEGVEARVLVLDDCSPDDTAAIGGRLAAADPRRVEYRRNERNLGLIATANRGLEWAADGDYVVLISADDLLVPGCLRRAAGLMEANPAVGMVYGHAPHFESNDARPGLGTHFGNRVWAGGDWVRRRCRSGKNPIASPEVVVRTAVQRRVGDYSAANPNTSDLNMWMRIAAVSDVGYVVGAAQALYRMHDASMFRTMLRDGGGAIADLNERLGTLDGAIAASAASLRDPEELRATVARTLAGEALWGAKRAHDRGATELAEALVGFAAEVVPEPRRLPGWSGLRLRRALGPGRWLWFPPFLATRVVKRLGGHLRWLRWRYAGV